ncbi:NAD(+)--dinitrogen-reductase ADP-D-ribosyltransferase, partial [Aromatoleum toluvorans]|uniref:NAD(+)--dinitrogen-reductase ADP-D-ribosyltransferase n=1 Tax=Aromatoleum toluvorans TaxID=92002 RepID=UPI001FE26C1F
TNLIGVPTAVLASSAFQDTPLPLAISGVRQTNAALFAMLHDARSASDAVAAFRIYMRAVFDLDAPPERDAAGRKRYRANYQRLLRGWGFDANGKEGAVLKGWVESRFGLLPTFHKEILGRYPSPAWMTYTEEKMAARFHNNCILLQLDLLYEFAQRFLRRWLYPGRSHLTLYRGVNDFGEHLLVERLDRRRAVVRQNNLVSFTTQRDVADQFGDTILEVDVPLSKILYCNAMAPGPVLRGEGEVLVIGGDYRVRLGYL